MGFVLLQWLCIYSGGQNGYNESLNIKLNLTLKVKVNQHKKIVGIFIWWFLLERVMSYRADKLGVDTRTHIHTLWHTDTGNDNTQRPKLASGKNWSSRLDLMQVALIKSCLGYVITYSVLEARNTWNTNWFVRGYWDIYSRWDLWNRAIAFLPVAFFTSRDQLNQHSSKGMDK